MQKTKTTPPRKKNDAEEFLVVAGISNFLQNVNILGNDFYISYFVKALWFCE